MSYNVFNIKHNDSIDIPVTDGVYETDLIDERFRNGVFVIIFFDIDGNIVTPDGGSIEPRMATFINKDTGEGQWLTSSSGDKVVIATDVKAGDADYTLPVFQGPTIKGKMELTGITGADYCRAFFWRTI